MVESLLKRDAKDIKLLLAISFLFSGLFFAYVNYDIYKKGQAFAKEHNAARVEIGYVDIDEIYSLTLLEQINASKFAPSFFRYYDENNVDIITLNSYELLEDYNNLNRQTESLYMAVQSIAVLIFLLDLFGFLVFFTKRRAFRGIVISFILTILILFQTGMLSYLSLIYAVGLIYSAIATYKARFIDINESLINPFKRNKKVEELYRRY